MIATPVAIGIMEIIHMMHDGTLCWYQEIQKNNPTGPSPVNNPIDRYCRVRWDE